MSGRERERERARERESERERKRERRETFTAHQDGLLLYERSEEHVFDVCMPCEVIKASHILVFAHAPMDANGQKKG